MAGQTGWGFVRDSANAQAYGDYLNMGLGGVLYNSEDQGINQGMSAAQAAGLQTGVWIPAHTGEDPIAYAQRMAAYAQKYHPAMLVPNVEFQGKGYKGSPGWDWSEKMMAEFRRLNPSQQLAVSVMGNQDDFNYEAYTGRGARVMAQAYDGAMNAWDPDVLRQQLIKRGVDPSLIDITLAPGGHAGSAGAYSAYTLDDMNPLQRQQYAKEVAAAQSRGASPQQAHDSAIAAVAAPVDKLARTNRTATDTRLLGANSVSHILTKKEIDALTPRTKAVAVQTVMARPPSKARQAARKIIKKRK